MLHWSRWHAGRPLRHDLGVTFENSVAMRKKHRSFLVCLCEPQPVAAWVAMGNTGKHMVMHVSSFQEGSFHWISLYLVHFKQRNSALSVLGVDIIYICIMSKQDIASTNVYNPRVKHFRSNFARFLHGFALPPGARSHLRSKMSEMGFPDPAAALGT